mmetsp:Transcript_33308/g.50360  ORF Transcript_33308/g.50360 Transcript_33308/m.50360 type:complete len:87 (-) Transcript_33308:22-282(-)
MTEEERRRRRRREWKKGLFDSPAQGSQLSAIRRTLVAEKGDVDLLHDEQQRYFRWAGLWRPADPHLQKGNRGASHCQQEPIWSHTS